MARIAHCEFKEDGCNDPRCKVGSCILQNEENARASRKVASEAEEIRKEAEKLAIEILERKRLGPTQQLIKKLSEDPRVLVAAKRRILAMRGLAAKL
jgi:hypothetical protein